MADAIEGTDIVAMHENIVKKLSDQFKDDFKLIEFYRSENDRTPLKKENLPALLLEVPDFELNLEEDAGTEQLPMFARIEARVVIDAMEKEQDNPTFAKLKVRTLALKLAQYLFKNKHFHELKTGPLTLLDVTEDAFYPGLDRYDVWRVDFSIPIHIGESIWKSEGVTPTAWFSWAPEIGSAHSSAYQEILP